MNRILRLTVIVGSTSLQQFSGRTLDVKPHTEGAIQSTAWRRRCSPEDGRYFLGCGPRENPFTNQHTRARLFGMTRIHSLDHAATVGTLLVFHEMIETSAAA